MNLAELAAAAAVAGLDGVALTDHGPGADFEAAHRALGHYRIHLVPGREVSCALGHVLVLSMDQAWLSALPPRVTLPLPPAAQGPVALVWAHPAGWHVGGFTIPADPSRGAEHLNAVEILNGERLWQTGAVQAAGRIAEDLRLAGTGGSDAHDPAALGRCLTEALGASDATQFIEALVAGEVRPLLSGTWAAANDTMYERHDLVPFLA